MKLVVGAVALIFGSIAYADQSAYSTCMGCHGMQGEGGVGPSLVALERDDFVSKMKAYRAGEALGPMSALMYPQAMNLNDETIEALADYVLTLK